MNPYSTVPAARSHAWPNFAHQAMLYLIAEGEVEVRKPKSSQWIRSSPWCYKYVSHDLFVVILIF